MKNRKYLHISHKGKFPVLYDWSSLYGLLKVKIKAGHEDDRVTLLLIVFHARLFGGVSLCGQWPHTPLLGAMMEY